MRHDHHGAVTVTLALPTPTANDRQYSPDFLMRLADETNRRHGIPVVFEHPPRQEPSGISSLQMVAGVARNVVPGNGVLACEICHLDAGTQAEALGRLLSQLRNLKNESVRFVPVVQQFGKVAAIASINIVKIPYDHD